MTRTEVCACGLAHIKKKKSTFSYVISGVVRVWRLLWKLSLRLGL